MDVGRVIAEIRKARTEWAQEGVSKVDLEKPLGFQLGVAHGRDQAAELMLDLIEDLISEEDDKERRE